MPEPSPARAAQSSSRPATGADTTHAVARPPRLVVFGPSPFGERARWALDRAGIRHEEVRWAPGPHAWLARRLGLQSSGTPILALDTGELVQGSGAILDRLGLPGADPGLERRLVERIGPLVRQFLYAAVLDAPDSGVLDALLDGVPPGQARAARLLWPATRRLIATRLQAKRALLPRLTADLSEELAWFAGVIDARGPFLAGRRFGRADLTAASMLAPLASPPACPVAPLYDRVRLPLEADEALAAWRRGPALTWARGVYDAHRLERAGDRRVASGADT